MSEPDERFINLDRRYYTCECGHNSGDLLAREEQVAHSDHTDRASASVVPFFRDSGFDADATQNMGKAYDIACMSLHPKGRPPVFQEILAKKIIEVAQRGERDPDGLRRLLWEYWASFSAT